MATRATTDALTGHPLAFSHGTEITMEDLLRVVNAPELPYPGQLGSPENPIIVHPLDLDAIRIFYPKLTFVASYARA